MTELSEELARKRVAIAQLEPKAMAVAAVNGCDLVPEKITKNEKYMIVV